MATWQDVIAAEMQARHWTQAELARQSGLSANTLSNVMTGITNPMPQTVERLAGAFNLTAGDLYARLAGAARPGATTDSGAGEVPAHTPPMDYLQQLRNLLDMMPDDARETIVADAKRKALQWLMDDEVGVPKRGA